jgi:hypothetical protein
MLMTALQHYVKAHQRTPDLGSAAAASTETEPRAQPGKLLSHPCIESIELHWADCCWFCAPMPRDE